MRTATLVLEHAQLHVIPDRGAAQTLAWEPQHPEWVSDAVVSLLQDSGGVPTSLVLVVGLAFLEAAQPALPPVASDVQHRMLLADHERFFVTDGPLAVVVDGAWAFACEATTMRDWWESFNAIATVRAVMALPTAIRLCGLTGTWAVPCGPGESGLVTVSSRGITDVRRSRTTNSARADHIASAGADAAASTASGATTGAAMPLDVPTCGRLLGTRDGVSLTDQLLDATLKARLVSQGRARHWRAAALVATGVLLFAWALSVRQARTIAALRVEHARLEALSSAPRAAQLRMVAAQQEQIILDAATGDADALASPLGALARIGAIVPADAFVQRLEWNGERWRIDGSAVDAARLVPLLDADSAIVDVQSLAPSTRFMDGGRPRNSFSIGFRFSGTPSAPMGAGSGHTP
ncbi:hypothetical protein [Gemmatimonas aurantiaca]|nr:hypothetical protein [Gemmatimonas aurantiaca]